MWWWWLFTNIIWHTQLLYHLTDFWTFFFCFVSLCDSQLLFFSLLCVSFLLFFLLNVLILLPLLTPPTSPPFACQAFLTNGCGPGDTEAQSPFGVDWRGRTGNTGFLLLLFSICFNLFLLHLFPVKLTNLFVDLFILQTGILLIPFGRISFFFFLHDYMCWSTLQSCCDADICSSNRSQLAFLAHEVTWRISSFVCLSAETQLLCWVDLKIII